MITTIKIVFRLVGKIWYEYYKPSSHRITEMSVAKYEIPELRMVCVVLDILKALIVIIRL